MFKPWWDYSSVSSSNDCVHKSQACKQLQAFCGVYLYVIYFCNSCVCFMTVTWQVPLQARMEVWGLRWQLRQPLLHTDTANLTPTTMNRSVRACWSQHWAEVVLATTVLVTLLLVIIVSYPHSKSASHNCINDINIKLMIIVSWKVNKYFFLNFTQFMSQITVRRLYRS